MSVTETVVWVRRFFGAVLIACLAWSATPAGAQDADGWANINGRPPPPPAGFEIRQADAMRWVYPESASDEVDELVEHAHSVWPQLQHDLGADVADEIEIRVARGPDEMRRLAPAGRPPPNYATGVAYTDLGLVVLSLTAPETWETPVLDDLLTHELSHIALRRAVGSRPLPRWFVEGVAIHQSGERSAARFRTLYSAALAHELIPVRNLSAAFSERSHHVNLAYAQSADFVDHLRSGDDRHPERFRTLIRSLREGNSMDAALQAAYAISLRSAEIEWKSTVRQRMSAIPTLVGGGTFWVLASLLVIWAFRKRRREARHTLEQWAVEERQEEELGLQEALDLTLVELEQSYAMTRSPDAGVPTVEVDGQSHTLH